MAEKSVSKASVFLVGLGLGSLLGVLFAPGSGEETREYLSQKAEEGRQYSQEKARELRNLADDMVGRGKEVVAQEKERIAEAIDVGREVYHREKSKTQNA